MGKTTVLARGMIPQMALLIGAFATFFSVASLFVLPIAVTHQADIRIEPSVGKVAVGDTFAVQIVVSADVPVNVFAGEIRFDPKTLQVESIDYNTSIADLWAELPWYENGEGTINFAGGTTKQGGFQSSGTLISITFRSVGTGVTALRLADGRILAHDGLGSEVAFGKPLEAVFEVEKEILERETISTPAPRATVIAVSAQPPSTDLNGDGKQTIADVSMFMLQMLGDDLRYDFNQDGRVNTADLSILMGAE